MNARDFLFSKLKGLRVSETEGRMKHMQLGVFSIVNSDGFLSDIMEEYVTHLNSDEGRKEKYLEWELFLRKKNISAKDREEILRKMFNT